MLDDLGQLTLGIIVSALVNGGAAFGLGYAVATGRSHGVEAVAVYLAAALAVSIPCTLLGLALGVFAFGIHDAGSYFAAYFAVALAVLIAAPVTYCGRIAKPLTEREGRNRASDNY